MLIPVSIAGSESLPANTAPRRFRVWEHDHDVKEVLDSWQGRDHQYYKVRVEDGAIYILRKDDQQANWELFFFSKR